MKINPLTPKWQHDDPGVRLQSVLSGKLGPEILGELAATDPDQSVRLAAIELIDDTNQLLTFAKSTSDTHMIAARRWATLVGGDLQHLGVVNADLPPDILTALAMHASSEDFRLKAIDCLSDEQQIMTVLGEENLSRVHQHCAAKIETEQNLQTVQQGFASRDKNVSRIAKSKLQEIRQSREEQATHHNALQTLQDKLTNLKSSELNPEFPRRVDALRQHWIQLSAVKAEHNFASIINGLISDCEELAESIPDPKEIRQALIDELIEQCSQLKSQFMTALPDAHASESLQNILDQWPADAESEKDFHTNALLRLINAQRSWQSLLSKRNKLSLESFQQALAALDWPAEFPQPENFEGVKTQIEQELKNKAEASEQFRVAQQDVQQLMDKFETEIDAGHIKAANRLSAKLTKRLEDFRPGGEQTSHIQQLMKKLQDLKDWQGFATQPKRDELCESMKRLAEDLAIPPVEKAKAIKELQTEWKGLGPADSRAAQKAWKRFKTFGDQAFAPCAEFYAEQEKVRLANLQQRETICLSLEEIETEYDWNSVDWKAVGTIIQRAKNEWRRYANVPRKQARSIEKRFDAALKPIQARLDAEQAVNAEKKSALIQQLVDAQTEDASVDNLIRQAKTAQQQWKSIGITQRRQDQKLWKAFRAQCDAVFAKRDEQKVAAKSAANAAMEELNIICREFRAYLDSDAPIDKQRIGAFRKTVSGMQADKKQKGFCDKLIKDAERLLKQQVAASKQEMMSAFQRQCRQLDQVDRGELAADAVQTEDITWDKKFSEALNNRASRSAEDQELIIIRLEILAGLESPAASQSQRMAYQVERLNKELSRGEKETRSEAEQIDALVMQWYGTKDKRSELDPRFNQIVTKLGLAVA